MPQICVSVSEELNKKFRIAAFEKFGYGKGSITKAGTEALTAWLDKKE